MYFINKHTQCSNVTVFIILSKISWSLYSVLSETTFRIKIYCRYIHTTATLKWLNSQILTCPRALYVPTLTVQIIKIQLFLRFIPSFTRHRVNLVIGYCFIYRNAHLEGLFLDDTRGRYRRY